MESAKATPSPSNTTRHFSGVVTRFGLGHADSALYSYRATLRPWLWLLTRTRDCRVFQNQTVPQIVEAVFNDHAAVANWEFLLLRSTYSARAYCVQYHETDFDFVARLLQEEGIYWYFEHSAQGHKLVLVDDMSQHTAAPGYASVPYFKATANVAAALPPGEWVTKWSFRRSVHTGQVTLRGYDFTRPGVQVTSSTATPPNDGATSGEEFDYLSQYVDTQQVNRAAGDRLDALQSSFERFEGESNAWGLATGHLFSLSGHPRADQNVQVLCLGTLIEATIDGYSSGSRSGSFNCHFSAMPAGTTYRAPLRVAKPRMPGPQTAVVVGSAGQEIETDSYGRVKLQFHWDRLGARNQLSSCWVRVSSPWAGNSFGFIQVPRIGDEVIVDFLEGDPDQPLITGRVYNASRMPPWALPANATQSHCTRWSS